MLEQIFSVCGALAMAGWALLVLLPRWSFGVEVLARLIIPGAISVVYTWLMVSNFGDTPEGGGFGSLAAVKQLFQVDALLLGGWVHYLAFDLFVGAWEVLDAQRRKLSHWWVLPCLALTLMAGPAGLLVYLVVRNIHARWYAQPVG